MANRLARVRLDRWEACNFCVYGKIRCDTLASPCSNCRKYGVVCLGIHDAAGSDGSLLIHYRHAMVNLELNGLPRINDSEEAFLQNQPEFGLDYLLKPRGRTILPRAIKTLYLPSTISIPPAIEADIKRLELPPFGNIVQSVERFFDEYNCFVPLFDEFKFKKMVLHFNSSPSELSIVPWAAINAVLAISYRLVDDCPRNDPKFTRCLINLVASTMHLIATKKDGMGVQVLLAMAILFQGSPDLQYSVKLIRTAMGIAREMDMIMPKYTLLESSEKLQRHKLFWIAFTLDRDLSIRARIPCSKTDTEFPTILPPEYCDMLTGRRPLGLFGLSGVSARTGSHFDYFRASCELALIQTMVNDRLCAHKSNKQPGKPSFDDILEGENGITHWYRCIPDGLKHNAIDLCKQLSALTIHFSSSLQNRFLELLLYMYSINFVDFKWCTKFRRFLRSAAIKDETRINNSLTNLGLDLPLDQWSALVKSCRLSLKVLLSGQEIEESLCLYAYSAFSSVMVLLFNIIKLPGDHMAFEDLELVHQTRGILSKINFGTVPGTTSFLEITKQLELKTQQRLDEHMNSLLHNQVPRE